MMYCECAFCEDTEAATHVPPPSEWTEYLETEHALPRATWSYTIPLCHACAADITELKRDYLDRNNRATNEAKRVERVSKTILDRVNTDLLVDASPMT